MLAGDIDEALDELLERTRMKPAKTGRATLVAVPDIADAERVTPTGGRTTRRFHAV
jgi:hypothetical protein